ncbi:MAG: hypothetical protein V1802_01860 [Candidatus Aenigmatarchaeota archaeon]
MISKKSNGFKIEIPPEMSGLIQKHHDTLIADDSLTDLDVVLVSIYLIENTNQKAGAKYSEVKDLFVSFGRKDDNFKVNIYQAKKKSVLKEKDKSLYFLSGGLKKIRKIFGQVGKSPVYVIKSGENFTAIKLFEEFLTSQFNGGEILLCDSHVSHSTLFPFSVLKGKIKSLKLLTTNVYDSDKFEDYKKKLSKELGIQIEVKTNQKIHDRFIIGGNKCWSIGSSIKDLGNKDATIREISEVVSSMKELFFERWKE